MTEKIQKTVMRFGLFEISLRSGELRKQGLRIRVPGQAFKILTILLERPGEVVTREELQKSLWPAETFVDFEHSLNSAVKKLREALRDSAENPRYIETVPRVGYRFIAPVAVTDSIPEALPVVTNPVSERTATPPRQGIRRALLIGSLLVLVAGAALVLLPLRRPRALPFERTKTTRLTSAGQSSKAEISPDGRYIAYTFLGSGQASLRVRLASTLHDVEIVPPEPVHYSGMTFSPDSQSVYYVIHSGDSVPVSLYRVAVMGGTREKLKEDLASPISFSPDGRRYAFVRESAGQSSLMIADLASGRERKLLSYRLPQVLDYPAWSPDGRSIACTFVDSSLATPKGSDARLIEVRVSDGTSRTLSARTWGFIKQLVWLRDGRGLVMSARGQESVFHVWYVTYPGGIGRKVTDGVNPQVGVSVSADSRQIVTIEESTLSGIRRLNSLQGREPEPLISGSSVWSAPVWMPDGRILFEKELNGSENIWAADADGANQKQLTLAGNSYVPSVSSDGRRLACVSDRSGSPAIWTMDPDGGNPVMVVKVFGDTIPKLSPDGRWIAYTAVGSGQWQTLWKVPAGGGQPVELNDKLWQRPAISPDGKGIAGFYADRGLSTNKEPTSIAVISSDGGAPSQVIPIPPSVATAAGIRWTPDGLQLTYVDRLSDGDNFWSRPAAGGPTRRLTHFQGESLFGFDWSRDGKQLLFSRGIQARDVVLIQQAGNE